MIDLKHPNARLTVADVQAIRTLLRFGYTVRSVARTFRVTSRAVDYIASGETWGNVPPEIVNVHQFINAPDSPLRLRGRRKPRRHAGAARGMVGAA